MGLFNSFISWIFKKRYGQVEQFIEHPHKAQAKVFEYLIRTAEQTEFGIEHDFQSIKTPADYDRLVPIRNYEGTKSYIERIMAGHQNVLWPTTINWFAKSSGTTSGKSKFIPVSRETLEECHYKGAKDVMAMYCHNNPNTMLFSGKGLVLGGSHQISELNDKSKYGDVSAVMMQNMPFWSQLFRTPELKIALLDEWEDKLERMAQTTISQTVTNIAGVPTWTMVLAKRLFEITGKSDLSEIWPDLELYIHGGVNFEPYRAQFESIISNPDMVYLQAYNASEGFFAIQCENKADDMLLMLDYGIFYEFITMDELEKDKPNVTQLRDVELGKNYAIIISTNSGLWRYKIGDTIQFTSLNPYKIKVTGRTRSFINAFGEEVIVENADKAIMEACKQHDCSFRDYTAAPIYLSGDNKGAHEWMIEFEKAPADLQLFTETLDATLQSLNSDYEAKRHKSIALELPHVQAIPNDTFNNWLKSKGKLGGQHKIPRLSNNRTIVDQIQELISTEQ